MTPEQPTAPRTVMKKVLVKRVKKILVKRPVAVPSATAPAVQAISRPAPNPNVPATAVPRPVQPSFAANAPTTRQHAPTPTSDAPRRPSFVGKIINGVEVRRLSYDLPDNILEEVEKHKRVTDKLLVLYVYARTYTQRVAKQEGYAYPKMMIELPDDNYQAAELLDEVNNDMLVAMLDDFTEMAPFIMGMERVMANKTPLEKIAQIEMARIQDQDSLSVAQQILISYILIMLDMQIINEKLDLMDVEDEQKRIIEEIRETEDGERALKQRFIQAIERRRFPVNARKLINNYFNLSRKEPDKAYHTLITNPLFFSPIQMERLPKKFFGLIKPGPKDAAAVNKRLASYLKSLKV